MLNPIPNQTEDSNFVLHLIDYSETGDQTLYDALKEEGFEVSTLTEGQLDLTSPLRKHPDMILLHLDRDGIRGLAQCRHLRTAFPRCTIFLVHDGLGEWEETIALELGADAVIPFPTETRRVVAQVRAFQRLKKENPSPQVPRLQLLAGSRSVRVNGNQVFMTDAEYDLLSLLAEQAGHPVSRNDICRKIRGLVHDDRDRTIDLRIARIRQKLGDNPHDPVFIRTVRGEGYMLMVSEA